jgi:hypothetical protein
MSINSNLGGNSNAYSGMGTQNQSMILSQGPGSSLGNSHGHGRNSSIGMMGHSSINPVIGIHPSSTFNNSNFNSTMKKANETTTTQSRPKTNGPVPGAQDF